MCDLFFSKQEFLPDGSPIVIIKLFENFNILIQSKLEKECLSFLDQGAKNLILNFSITPHIHSHGWGSLIKLVDIFQKNGGSIRLVLPPKMTAFLQIITLSNILRAYPTEQEAIASIIDSI